MVFLDFEKPIAELYEELEKLKHMGEKQKIDIAAPAAELEERISNLKKEIYSLSLIHISEPTRPY